MAEVGRIRLSNGTETEQNPFRSPARIMALILLPLIVSTVLLIATYFGLNGWIFPDAPWASAQPDRRLYRRLPQVTNHEESRP